MPKEMRPASWPTITAVMRRKGMRILLCGCPGIGKTAGAFGIGKFLKQDVQKVQCQSELSPAEVLGMYVPDEKSFRWEPGPIDICYRGGILVLDELVEASGPVKTFLYGALDRGPGGTISYVGRTFKQTEDYSVIATMNEYPDSGGLPAALLDRFDACFVVSEPSPPLYKLLEPDLRMICRDSYKTASDPMLGPPITFRMLLSLQNLRKMPELSLEDAIFASCYANKTLAASLYEIMILAGDDIDEDETAEGMDAEDEDPDTADDLDLGSNASDDDDLDDDGAEHPADCTCEECAWGDDDGEDDDEDS